MPVKYRDLIFVPHLGSQTLPAELPVEVGHVLLELVHLVAQQGCVRDPKCGTEKKSRYLTGIQWWWFQVSRMPYARLIFVRKMLRSGRFRVSSTGPGEEKKVIQSHRTKVWTCIDLPLKGICLNTPGRGPGNPLNMGSFHSFAF